MNVMVPPLWCQVRYKTPSKPHLLAGYLLVPVWTRLPLKVKGLGQSLANWLIRGRGQQSYKLIL